MTDEFDLIRQLFKPLADDPAALDLSDDAAILAPGEGGLVIAKDILIENVHFRSEDPLDLVARKALRVNLSDLAAMGATPRGYLLGLAVPRGRFSLAALTPFAADLGRDQSEFGVSLLGGDTTRTDGPLVVSVTAIGEAPAVPLQRKGARPGDAIYVSGMIGDAGLGLKAFDAAPNKLSERHVAFLQSRYQLPMPRVALGSALAGVASAGLDVSDGLVADLGHLASASGIGVNIELERVPLSEAARAWLREDGAMSVTDLAIAGDDYELAFAISPDKEERILEIAENVQVSVTRIGAVVEGSGVRLQGADGSDVALQRHGWNHGAS